MPASRSQESGGQSAPDRTAQQRVGRVGKVTRRAAALLAMRLHAERENETKDDNADSWMEDLDTVSSWAHFAKEVRSSNVQRRVARGHARQSGLDFPSRTRTAMRAAQSQE